MKFKQKRDDESAPQDRYKLVTGVLAARGGIVLEQVSPQVLRCTVKGVGTFDIETREYFRNGKHYLELTVSGLKRIKKLWRLLKGRFDRKRKSMAVHQLVAIVAHRAVLLASDQGRLAVHHLNHNSGDNRAGNLVVLTTKTHDELHKVTRAYSAEKMAEYLASIPATSHGYGRLPKALVEKMKRDKNSYHEVERVSIEAYYPDAKRVSGLAVTLIGATERPALSEAQLHQIGNEVGEPADDVLNTTRGRQLVAMRLTQRLDCEVMLRVLKSGGTSLDAESVASAARLFGHEFVVSEGALYMYNKHLGRYGQAQEAFERGVTALCRRHNAELQDIEQAMAPWSVKAKRKVLAVLPRRVRPSGLIQACKETLYREWAADGRMNGDQWTLNLRNGLLDLKTQRLAPHSPEALSSLQLPYDYDPKAECPNWHAFLGAAMPDAEVRAHIQEAVGYFLIPTTWLERIWILLGPGGTGKSTLIKSVRLLVGVDNCSAVALEDLDDKFRLGSLRDKLLNVVTEVNPKRALNDARLKAVVSGDPITGEEKFKNPGVFQPYARFLVATNTMPRVDDGSDAFYRRAIVLHFTQKFVANPRPDVQPPERPQDPDLGAKLEAELSGILNWALEGLARLQARGRFEIPASVEKNVRDYRENQDSVLRFVTDQCRVAPGLEVSASELYRAYVNWCRGQGEKPHSVTRFGNTVAGIDGIRPHKTGPKGRHYVGVRPFDAMLPGA